MPAARVLAALPAVVLATVGVAAAPAGAQAPAASVTPTCAAPGGPVRYAAPVPAAAGEVALRWVPRLVDPRSGAVAVTAPGRGAVAVGSLPIAPATDATTGTVAGAVAFPDVARTAGALVDGWTLEPTAPGGQALAPLAVDSAARRVLAPATTRTGTRTPVVARGFGARAVSASLVRRGRAVRTVALAPATGTDAATACGSASGAFSARSMLSLAPGTYALRLATRRGGPALVTQALVVRR